MGQTTDPIEHQMENKREDLKSNLQEFQTRVKTATDWRHYFAEYPGTMIAVAFGGGVLLAAMIGGRGSRVAEVSGRLLGIHAPIDERNQTRDRGKPGLYKERVGGAGSNIKPILGEVAPGLRSLDVSVHVAKHSTDRVDPIDQRQILE
jgi:hypothetical protein